MTETPTLMAVHAHPDDEATSTGGILAKYGDEGFRTIVVTCTNGELGDLPGGIKPDTEGHDEEEVVRLRMKELELACEILKVSHIELLGYRDSGMADWEHKGHADAFCNVPLDEAVDKLSKLFDLYRPDVVVTYDEASGYNHPDHIQASRMTQAAVERTGIPKKFYFTGSRANRWTRIREILEERGVELPPRPEPDPEMIKRMQALEAKITTSVDVGPFVDRKLMALRAHVSQVGEQHWSSRIPDEAYRDLMGIEHYVRVLDTTDAPLPEDDLFAGLR
jgi:LmbE family N-acetylglucosaminyl deacetylase